MLGARIRKLRLARDPVLEQADLARQAGVEPQTLYRIEKGKVTNPGINVVREIARVLGVTVDELVSEPATEPGGPDAPKSNGAAA